MLRSSSRRGPIGAPLTHNDVEARHAMKPAPFEYARPSHLDEACALLARADDSRVIAGGQSLVPLMAMRLARPKLLVDHGPGTRDAAYLRRLSSEYNLPIVALHNPFAPSVTGWPDDQLGRLSRTIALAQQLDVPTVVAHLPYRLAGVVVRWNGAFSGRFGVSLPWNQRKPWYHACAEGRVAEMEAASGVQIAVENMPRRGMLGLSLPLYWFNRPERMTISIGLRMFQTRDEGHLEWTMAMTVLSVIPLIVIFFIAQRRFIQGIVLTGIKG